ncbi:hypothetical protein Tco_0027382 [Tanacetum coccineum]
MLLDSEESDTKVPKNKKERRVSLVSGFLGSCRPARVLPKRTNRCDHFETYCPIKLGIEPTVDGIILAGIWRAIPDAMAWRHHDSDVYDAVPDNDFSTQDVQSLTERVIDLRPVPSGLLFGAGLATTWEFPGYLHVLKNTEGNVVTMSEYLRFPFLSGASITRGAAVPANHPIGQNTTPLLQADQPILDKTDSQREVETKDAKVRKDGAEGSSRVRKKRVLEGAKDVTASSGHVSSPTPLQTVSPSAHHFTDIKENQGEESLPRMKPLVNLSGQPTHPPKEPVFVAGVNVGGSSHLPNTLLTGRHVEEGEPSRNAAVYVIGWNIPRRCRVDTPEWCRELMTHLAPPAAQEESNALTNEVALQRAWFNVAQGAMAQMDMLERFENLLANYDNLVEAHAECPEMTVREEHARCGQRIQILEKEKNYMPSTNHDQAARIVSLEAELAKKDSDLTYSERLLAEGARERERLTVQLGQAEIKKFECIRKLLPTVVGRFMKSHEYKESLSGPLTWLFKLDGVKKLYPMYDKLFEKQYSYVQKIARGYRHLMADLLKVYPDPAPSQGTSNLNTSKAFGRPLEVLFVPFGAMRSGYALLARPLEVLLVPFGAMRSGYALLARPLEVLFVPFGAMHSGYTLLAKPLEVFHTVLPEVASRSERAYAFV